MSTGFRQAKRGSRYKVSPVGERTVDGVVFDSKAEANAYLLLSRLIPSGELRLQEQFELQEGYRSPTGDWRKRVVYTADFTLGKSRASAGDAPAWPFMVVDVKGVETPVFRLKRALFEQRYDLPIWLCKKKADLLQLADLYGRLKNMISPEIFKGDFVVRGYRNSDGYVKDLTVSLLPRGGYKELVRESLEMLGSNPEEVIRKAGLGQEDILLVGTALSQLEVSLSKSLSRSEAELAKSLPAGLVGVGHGVFLADGDPERVVLLGLRCLSEVVLEVPEPAKVETMSVSLAKKRLEHALPKGSFLPRLNLYPGKYVAVEPAV